MIAEASQYCSNDLVAVLASVLNSLYASEDLEGLAALGLLVDDDGQPRMNLFPIVVAFDVPLVVYDMLIEISRRAWSNLDSLACSCGNINVSWMALMRKLATALCVTLHLDEDQSAKLQNM